MKLAALRSPYVVVLLLCVALAAMTAPRVFAAPLWGDELRTWRDGIDRPLMVVLAWQHNPDHAPLGHLLARGGAALFGVDRPWALRLGAWLCGLACVPALYCLGRRVHSPAAGCLMALMFVVDPTQVFQLTQARMYPPMILAGIVALTLAAGLFQRPSESLDDRYFVVVFGPRDWVAALGIAISIGVGIWAHAQIYAVVLALIVAAIVHAAWHGRDSPDDHGRDARATNRMASIALMVAVVAGLGLGGQGVAKLVGNRSNPQVIDANVTLERPAEQLEDASEYLTGHNVLTGGVVAATIVGLVVIGRQRGPATAVLLGATVAFAVVNLLVAARYRPVAHARYLAIAQPAIWCAVAALLVEIARLPALRRGTGVGALVTIVVGFVGLCGFQLWRTLDVLPAHPLAAAFREACRHVNAHRVADARVVVLPASPLAMYAKYYGVTADDELDAALTRPARGRERRAAVAAMLGGDRELWLIGIVPTTLRWRDSGDDPLVANAAIARARGIVPTTLPTTTDQGLREVVVVRFGADGSTQRVPLRGRDDVEAQYGEE